MILSAPEPTWHRTHHTVHGVDSNSSSILFYARDCYYYHYRQRSDIRTSIFTATCYSKDEILKYYILNMHTLTLMCSTHGCDDRSPLQSGRYAFYKLCEKGMINFSEWFMHIIFNVQCPCMTACDLNWTAFNMWGAQGTHARPRVRTSRVKASQFYSRWTRFEEFGNVLDQKKRTPWHECPCWMTCLVCGVGKCEMRLEDALRFFHCKCWSPVRKCLHISSLIICKLWIQYEMHARDLSGIWSSAEPSRYTFSHLNWNWYFGYSS